MHLCPDIGAKVASYPALATPRPLGASASDQVLDKEQGEDLRGHPAPV